MRQRQREDKLDAQRIAEGSGLQHGAVLPTTNGHINLFEDLEHAQQTIAAAIRSSSKKAQVSTAESEKGVALAPSVKDLNPWYSERNAALVNVEVKNVEDEKDQDKHRREELRKSANDPLTAITRQLAARSGSGSSLSSRTAMKPPPLPRLNTTPNDVDARLSRESSERERALALIRRKKREMEGNMTPSTVADDSTGEYGDMYNRKEVREAHQHRDRRGYDRRRWDEDEKRRRKW